MGTIIGWLVFWLVCSFFVSMTLGSIDPANRDITKPRRRRLLMIVGGPLTIAGCVVVIFVAWFYFIYEALKNAVSR